MEDVVASLFSRIDELEQAIQRKDNTIKVLNEQLNSARSGRAEASDPLPQLEHQRSVRKAYQTDQLQFVSSLTGEEVTLTFPEKSTLAPPTLTRQQTLRTQLAELFGETRHFFDAKDKLKQELDAKLSVFEEQHRLNIELATSSYDSDVKRIDEALRINLGGVGVLEGKICVSKNSQAAYTISSFNRDTFELTLDKLFDKNGIRLKNPVQFTKPLHEIIGLSALDTEQTEEFFREIPSKEHIITVNYQLVHVDDELMCCPVSIHPPGLSLNDYEIRFTKASSEITSVVSKPDGEVYFNAVRYDDSCGFVSTSLVEVYLNEISPHVVNLVHLHIEDTSSEIAIDTAYILPNQSWRDYQDFSLDVQSRPLRYKVIVKEGRVVTVLYNTGAEPKELFFIQRNVEAGSLVKVGKAIARVEAVPTGLVVRDWKGTNEEVKSVYNSQSPISYCTSRHLEDLPGLIDLEVFAENCALLAHTRRVSVPICSTETLSPADLALLELLYERQNQQKRGSLEAAIEELSQFIEKFRAHQVASSAETLAHLRELDSIVRDGLDAGLRTQHAQLLRDTEKALRIIASDLRFSR